MNEQAARIGEWIERGANRASIARRLAQRVADGQDILDASLAVKDAELAESGRVVDIAEIGAVDSPAVTIRGRIEQLWEPNRRAIQDVGLIADESGRVKFTTWAKPKQPTVAEGERGRLTNVSKSWHQGRVSVAVTGWSHVTSLDEQGRRPTRFFRRTPQPTSPPTAPYSPYGRCARSHDRLRVMWSLCPPRRRERRPSRPH